MPADGRTNPLNNEKYANFVRMTGMVARKFS